MKGSESESGCKAHPNNKHLPGVCSSCLRDKLAQLYRDSTTKPADSLPRSVSHTGSPQSFSSAASSKYVSPAYLSRRHRRNASDVMDSVSSTLSFNYRLKKSRSIAFASRSGVRARDRDVSEGWKRGRKKDGLWSKLLNLTRKGTKDAFMHSGTLRERRG